MKMNWPGRLFAGGKCLLAANRAEVMGNFAN